MISIIMPSYLGNYQRAAKNRDVKIIRAIDSVVNQSFTDWELVIIADGCTQTVNIICDYLMKCSPNISLKINGYSISKSKAWSGKPRNTGIEKAKGDFICYLDIDDIFKIDHLQFISNNIKLNDWIWFDDMIYNGSDFITRKCSITNYGHCGTSNIAHKRNLSINEKPIQWPMVSHYSYDDWVFIRGLKEKQGSYIGAGGYMVGHIPDKYDV